MKRFLTFSLMLFLLFFCINEKSYAKTASDEMQYFRIIDDIAYPITQAEAESLVNKARENWKYKTNIIYSKAAPSTSVASLKIKYTTVISGGRPQFDLVGVDRFAPENNYNAAYEVITATGDVITFRIDYSDMLDSGSKMTSFIP